MRIQRRNVKRAIMVGVFLGLAACATPQAADRGEADLKTSLETIKQREVAGQTGTLKGMGVLTVHPAPPVVLDHAAVTLVPSTPQLEAALAAINRRWQENRRHPVTVSEFQAAFALLDRHVRTLQDLGERALLRLAETDDKGQFTFDAVPAGRWILIATMESPVSAILWAIPGDVKPGETAQVIAANNNILIEGRMTKEQTAPSR